MIRVILSAFLFSLLANAQSLDEVKLYLKWKHQFQFAGYYAAVEKGFYKEEGLDVDIIERDVSWTAPDKVRNEEGHYGIIDSSIVRYHLEGDQFFIVAPIFQHSPLVLITRAEDEILSPSGLKGKKVMYQKGVDDAVFKIMFRNANLSENDFKHVPHSFKNDDLINKKVDAVSVYQTNQPFYYKKKGLETRIINPMNYGVDLYGDMLFTNKVEADKFPDRVAAMRRATIKGWYYALNNIEEMINIIKSRYNPRADIELLRYEANETKKFVESHIVPIGTSNPTRLQRIANIYGERDPKSLEDLKYLIFQEYRNKKSEFIGVKIGKILTVFSIFTLIVVFVIFYFNRKLTKEVEEKTKHIKAQQDERNLLFSKLTHELRTPLNAIMGSSFFLNELVKDPETQSYVKIIDNSSKLLLGLVDDILDFSKLEVKQIKLNNEAYQLFGLLRESLTVHEISCRSKGIEFELNLLKDEDICLEIDSLRFKQIINNLISNAIKFTKKGKITVSCDYQKIHNSYEISIEVIDTGKGIPEDKMESVFNPFEQEDESISKEFGGTGLGLGITKELVALYDGSISVRRNEPQGSIFSYQIYCKESDKKNVKSLKPKRYDIPKDLKVLIVDDNNLNLLMLRKYLQKIGIQPLQVANGEEALLQLESGNIEVVIIDKLMPVMDGEETTKKIRSHRDPKISSVYIIGNSANWSDGLDQECREVGMNASLAKPVKFPSLQRVLSDYISYKESQNSSDSTKKAA